MLTKWSDWLLAAWAVFVAIVYYGGSAGAFGGALDAPISQWIAVHTEALSAVYALMFIVSVLSAVFAAMRKSPPPKTQ